MPIRSIRSARTTRFLANRYALALACLLPFSSLWAADYDAAVKARLITKTELTGNGERIRYPAFASPEVSALEVDIAVGAETVSVELAAVLQDNFFRKSFHPYLFDS